MTALLVVGLLLAVPVGIGVPADDVQWNDDGHEYEDDEDSEDDPYYDGSSSHVHDYWKDRRTAVLVDRTVQADPVQDAAALEDPSRSVIPLPLGPGLIPGLVYPGTDEITVQVSWDPSADQARPSVCANLDETLPEDCSSAGSADKAHAFHASGETWTIAVDETETDAGHSARSNWRFVLDPCVRDLARGSCLTEAREIGVRIAVHRVDDDPLPMEPPHLDYYGDDERLALLDDRTVASGQAKDTARSWYRTEQRDRPTPLFVADGRDVEEQFHDDQADVTIVPPGTQTVDAVLKWSSETPADLELRYRTPVDAPGEWRTAPEADLQCVSVDPGESCVVYEIPIRGLDETDGFYEDVTDWEFGIFLDEDAPVPLADYEVELSVIASANA